MKKEKEIWKNIWDGLYSVSNYGNIRSNDRYINTVTGIRKFTGKLLKTDPTKDNHLRVTLSNGGIKKRIFVHRLVAECFIPNPLNLPIINHIDEDPTNNYYKNLEWCTNQYNIVYNDTHLKRGDKEGTDIDVYDLNGNYIESFPSITKTAIKYNCPLTTLFRRIKSGKSYLGYYFKQKYKV